MKTLMMAALAATLTFLGGCNTVGGVGKDVKAGGAAIENAADKTQKQM